MGDAPVAYVEGAGGTRVAEDQIVAVGKNDVSSTLLQENSIRMLNYYRFYLSKSDDSTGRGNADAKQTQPLNEYMLMIPGRKVCFFPCF